MRHAPAFHPPLIFSTVPWNYPNLSNESITTSPFTIVFKLAGSSTSPPYTSNLGPDPPSAAAASFMNTVILTSVVSAGNHALFAGTRVLYGLSVVSPRRQAPAIFSKTTPAGVPIFALLATSSISVLCLASSFIGSGQLWGWLQNIVGVSNQVSPTSSIVPILTACRLHGYPLVLPAGDSEKPGLPRTVPWTN